MGDVISSRPQRPSHRDGWKIFKIEPLKQADGEAFESEVTVSRKVIGTEARDYIALLGVVVGSAIVGMIADFDADMLQILRFLPSLKSA